MISSPVRRSDVKRPQLTPGRAALVGLAVAGVLITIPLLLAYINTPYSVLFWLLLAYPAGLCALLGVFLELDWNRLVAFVVGGVVGFLAFSLPLVPVYWLTPYVVTFYALILWPPFVGLLIYRARYTRREPDDEYALPSNASSRPAPAPLSSNVWGTVSLKEAKERIAQAGGDTAYWLLDRLEKLYAAKLIDSDALRALVAFAQQVVEDHQGAETTALDPATANVAVEEISQG